jgi:hypothetical protein
VHRGTLTMCARVCSCSELAVLIAPVQLPEDVGVVVVAGSVEHSHAAAASAQLLRAYVDHATRGSLSSGPFDGVRTTSSRNSSDDSTPAERHFSLYAFVGSSGSLLWKHEGVRSTVESRAFTPALSLAIQRTNNFSSARTAVQAGVFSWLLSRLAAYSDWWQHGLRLWRCGTDIAVLRAFSHSGVEVSARVVIARGE